MPLHRLDHYLVIARDLEATREFYAEVLGLQVGPRPPFPFAGYWMYLGDTPCVHVADASRRPATEGEGAAPTGALDHVAFAATGLEAMLARLQRLGIPVRRRKVPEQGLQQLFVVDPNGLTIELNYPASEEAATVPPD